MPSDFGLAWCSRNADWFDSVSHFTLLDTVASFGIQYNVTTVIG